MDDTLKSITNSILLFLMNDHDVYDFKTLWIIQGTNHNSRKKKTVFKIKHINLLCINYKDPRHKDLKWILCPFKIQNWNLDSNWSLRTQTQHQCLNSGCPCCVASVLLAVERSPTTSTNQRRISCESRPLWFPDKLLF